MYRAKSALKPGNEGGARPLTLADFMPDGKPPAVVVSGSRAETGPDSNHALGLRIFINDDLTAQQASLLYQARQLKKKREINDCWSVDGQILIKDTANKVIPIHKEADLKKNASRLVNP